MDKARVAAYFTIDNAYLQSIATIRTGGLDADLLVEHCGNAQ